jgi:hypothetical protein
MRAQRARCVPRLTSALINRARRRLDVMPSAVDDEACALAPVLLADSALAISSSPGVRLISLILALTGAAQSPARS